MKRSLDFYFSFRSPYSYLALGRVLSITDQFDLDTRLKIVRPLALREPDFFKKARPQFLPYMFKDMVREAARFNIPFEMPNPDPIVMDMTSGTVAPDQPFMDIVLKLGFAACAQAKPKAALDYAHAIASMVWGGQENWHEETHLRSAAITAGLDHDALIAWGQTHADQRRQSLEENEREQLTYHWGVPLMVLEGEPFFGQDRLDALVWRLEQS